MPGPGVGVGATVGRREGEVGKQVGKEGTRLKEDKGVQVLGV